MVEELTKIGTVLPSILTEMLVAIVCGGLIALTRGKYRKSTSLRDSILICLGSVLFVNIPDLISLSSGTESVTNLGTVTAQIILGISLLGAGIIISDRTGSSGLTTAANIWIVGAIGLVIGLNQWLLGMLITGLVLLILTLLNGLERSLATQTRPLLLKMTVRQDDQELRENLNQILKSKGVEIQSFRSELGPNGTKVTIQAVNEPEDIRKLVGELWTVKGITEIEH